jgi:hypothetical protein
MSIVNIKINSNTFHNLSLNFQQIRPLKGFESKVLIVKKPQYSNNTHKYKEIYCTNQKGSSTRTTFFFFDKHKNNVLLLKKLALLHVNGLSTP